MKHKCSRCKTDKDPEEFSKNKSAKNGLHHYCKTCVSTFNKHLRNSNPKQKDKEQQRRDKLKTKTYEEDILKICSSCLSSKSIKDFYKSCTGSFGVESKCKTCRNHQKKLKRDLPEVKAKIKENSKTWIKNNRSKVNKQASYRRSYKKTAIPSWVLCDELNTFIIEEIYNLCELRSLSLGIKFNVDHIVPLKSKLVCGLHCPANLQILSAKANLIKGNRYWPDMP